MRAVSGCSRQLTPAGQALFARLCCQPLWEGEWIYIINRILHRRKLRLVESDTYNKMTKCKGHINGK